MRNDNDFIDWPNHPNLLIGRRINIEMKNGRIFKGMVTRYNTTFKLHTILYDDNIEKEYDLFFETFQIVIN